MQFSVVFAVAVFVAEAHGDIIPFHANVAITLSGSSSDCDSGNYSAGYSETSSGANEVSLNGVFQGVCNGHQFVETYAGANPVSVELFKLRAYSASDRSGYFVPEAFGASGAGWRDIVRISSPTPAPDSIRLRFAMEGKWSAFRIPDDISSYASADFGFYFTSDLSTFYTSVTQDGSYQGYGYLGAFSSFSVLRSEGMELTLGPDGNFRAVFEREAGYDQTLDGYAWNLSASVRTRAQNAIAEGDLLAAR